MGLFDKPAAPTKPTGVAKKVFSAKKAFSATKVAAPVKKAGFRPVPATQDEPDDDGAADGDGAITTGWGGAKQLKADHSSYANRYKMADKETRVGKFLDDGPYANVATHWLGEGKKKRSYICLGPRICPLCHIGDTAKVTYNFNWMVLTTDKPVLYSWEASQTVCNLIEEKAQKYPPLPKRWYTATRTGTGMNDTVYGINVVIRLDDLEEDPATAGLHIPSTAEIAAVEAKKYTVESAMKGQLSLAKMKEIAAQASGEGEFDPGDDDE